jgi:hypothetical protein
MSGKAAARRLPRRSTEAHPARSRESGACAGALGWAERCSIGRPARSLRTAPTFWASSEVAMGRELVARQRLSRTFHGRGRCIPPQRRDSCARSVFPLNRTRVPMSPAVPDGGGDEVESPQVSPRCVLAAQPATTQFPAAVHTFVIGVTTIASGSARAARWAGPSWGTTRTSSSTLALPAACLGSGRSPGSFLPRTRRPGGTSAASEPPNWAI